MRVTVAGPTAFCNGRVALRGGGRAYHQPVCATYASPRCSSSCRGQQGGEPREDRAVRSAGGRAARGDRRVPRVLHHRLLVHAAISRASNSRRSPSRCPKGRPRTADRALAQRHGDDHRGGLVETPATACFTTATSSRCPTARAVRHRKIHAFEHDCIRSGDEYTVFDMPDGFRAGVLICYDCNLIENVRLTALRGAEILIAPHQTGGCRRKNPHLMGVIDRRALGQSPRRSRRRSSANSAATRAAAG